MSTLLKNEVVKGDALGVSRIAGIQAAKLTSVLIPLCHNIPLSAVHIEIRLFEDRNEVRIRSLVRTESKTGVEMEALTAVSVAALALYDMCKSITHEMTITGIRLLGKAGGKSTFGELVL
ncbi:unnamed protein product [Gongylonema pulchrum]|uniref:MoaC domain-containing protein n=1 Tax=Gongylonema pulchrum TaxID=637853 RepID=A0A183EC80_9BILA|nr:unnamed protein product [Gongylonema pulchrum]